jgi:succinoglycan biosynthesis transport protein ExoP
MTLEVLREVWRRRKWLAIVVFLIAFATVGAIVTSLPNVYRSTVTVLVERHQVSEAFVRPSITGELETRLQTISQDILSRARLEALITRLGLYRDPKRQVPMELLVEKMRRDIGLELKAVDQTSGRGQTIAFALRYQGRDPQTVALVANTLASFYVAANVKLREEQAAGTAEFLRLQLEEMSKRVTEQEQRVRDYRARYVGALPEQTAANLATVERLHAQVQLNSADQLRAMDRRAVLLRQLAEARQLIQAKQADAPGTLEGTIAEIAKLKQQLTLLRQRFTDRYPEVVRLKSEIAALERTLVRTKPDAEKQPAPTAALDQTVLPIQDALGDAEREIDRFKAEERRLRRDVAVYQQRIDNAPQREQEFRELSRDYDTTKELQGSLLKRYEDARLAETMEQRQRGEQFRILDPALPARAPAAPNRLKLLFAGVLLSLGAAAGAVMLAAHLDTSFHTVDALRSMSSAPVVVSIPLIVTERDRRRQKLRFAVTTAAVTVALVFLIKAAQYLATGNEALVGLLSRGA